MKFFVTLGQRLSYAAILVLAVIVLNFILVRMAPGDPAELIAGEMGGTTIEILEEIRHSYGLDKPIYVQLGIYLGRMAHGDLGQSYFYDASVSSLILDRLGPTLLLVLSSLAFALIIGTTLGVLASRRPTGLFSNVVTVLALVGYSAPVFWTGMLLVILFASMLPIFPISDMSDIALSGGWFIKTLDVLHHLVMPSFTLGIMYLAQ
jgi:peptide/nickel transport system permease protein